MRRHRVRDQPARTASRGPEEEVPERQIKPAKIFRMPFVLQIVEHGNHRAATQQGRGKTGIKQNVQPMLFIANGSASCSQSIRAGRTLARTGWGAGMKLGRSGTRPASVSRLMNTMYSFSESITASARSRFRR